MDSSWQSLFKSVDEKSTRYGSSIKGSKLGARVGVKPEKQAALDGGNLRVITAADFLTFLKTYGPAAAGTSVKYEIIDLRSDTESKHLRIKGSFSLPTAEDPSPSVISKVWPRFVDAVGPDGVAFTLNKPLVVFCCEYGKQRSPSAMAYYRQVWSETDKAKKNEAQIVAFIDGGVSTFRELPGAQIYMEKF